MAKKTKAELLQQNTDIIYPNTNREITEQKLHDHLEDVINHFGVEIPILKLESKRYTPDKFDFDSFNNPGKLFASWETDNVEFLNYNPEIWLFVHRKNRRKFSNGDVLYKRKFAHPPHLNGIKYPASSWYSGVGENRFGIPYHSEFDCPVISGNSLEIPINVYEWLYYDDGSGNSVQIDAETALTNRDYRFSGQKEGTLFATMKLAIVIDNPDDTINNPKIIGGYSKPFALHIRPKAGGVPSYWDIRFEINKK